MTLLDLPADVVFSICSLLLPNEGIRNYNNLSNLRLCSSVSHKLIEQYSRHLLVQNVGTTVTDKLKKDSGRSYYLLYVASLKDYCFFDKSSLATAESDCHKLDSLYSLDAHVGSWRLIENAKETPWGQSLYAANVHWLHLVCKPCFTTPGLFTAYMDFRAMEPLQIGTFDFFLDKEENDAHVSFETVFTIRRAVSQEVVPMEVMVFTAYISQPGCYEFHIREEGRRLKRSIMFNYLVFEKADGSSEVVRTHKDLVPERFDLYKMIHEYKSEGLSKELGEKKDEN